MLLRRNPGAVLSEDPHAHIAHLKTAPVVEAEVDRCVECGYCEPVCPSKDLTLTPRKRIVLRRELAKAQQAGNELNHDQRIILARFARHAAVTYQRVSLDLLREEVVTLRAQLAGR